MVHGIWYGYFPAGYNTVHGTCPLAGIWYMVYGMLYGMVYGMLYGMVYGMVHDMAL